MTESDTEQSSLCRSTDTVGGEPCAREVSDGLCYLHDDDRETPDEHGAPTGNDNAVGNAGGDGAPAENDYAERHGLYSDEGLLYHRLEPREQRRVDLWAGDIRDDVAAAQGSDVDELPGYYLPMIERTAMLLYKAAILPGKWHSEQADETLDDDVDNPLVDRIVVAFDSDGELRRREVRPSAVEAAAIRCSREARNNLSEWGVFDPDAHGGDDVDVEQILEDSSGATPERPAVWGDPSAVGYQAAARERARQRDADGDDRGK